MNKPEDLRRITENTLHGLVADDSLKFRILQKAAGRSEEPAGRSFRAVPALCGVLAALLMAVLALNSLSPVQSAGPGEIIAFTAGKTDSGNSSLFPDDFDPDSVVKIELSGIGTVTDPQLCTALASVLMEQAKASEDDRLSADRHLIVSAADGTAFTFYAEDPFLISDDGHCWSCTAFFSKFNNLIK